MARKGGYALYVYSGNKCPHIREKMDVDVSSYEFDIVEHGRMYTDALVARWLEGGSEVGGQEIESKTAKGVKYKDRRGEAK